MRLDEQAGQAGNCSFFGGFHGITDPTACSHLNKGDREERDTLVRHDLTSRKEWLADVRFKSLVTTLSYISL